MTRRFEHFSWSGVRRTVTVLLSLWVVSIVVLLAFGAREAARGQHAARSAQRTLTAESLADGRAKKALDDAARRLGRSARLLDNPLTFPVTFVPVLGRQLRTVEAIVASADRISSASLRAATDLELVANDPPTDGAARVRAVDELVAAVVRVERAVGAADLGPADGLFPPVADRRNEAAWQLAELEEQVGRATTAARAASAFVSGPRNYLLVAANNAEMRAGAGMFLSAGPLTIADGAFELGEMTPAGEMELDRSVALDSTTDQLWGWTEPGREWRNLQMSPRFEASAPLAAAMWEARTGDRVDGVLALDVIALRALLTATGELDVGGRTVSADNVEQLLFVEQYEGLAVEDGAALEGQQAARREQLGTIASAVVSRIDRGDVDLLRLTEELADAAGGRHLLLWSRDEDEEEAWEAAGVAGTLRDPSMLLAVLNRGGNKLDVHVEVDAEIIRTDDEVTVTVDIRNQAPDDLPPYAAGPDPDIRDQPPATYIGLVALTVPGSAHDLLVEDGDIVVAGPDGPTRVIATDIVVPRGGAARLTFSFRLPSDAEIAVEPGARVPATSWSDGVSAWRDDERRVLRPTTERDE